MQADTIQPRGPQRRIRRRIVITGLAAVLTLVAASIGFFAWLPHYRPVLRSGERYGIDVSNYQGAINWGRVASGDIAFAYIKATEGSTYIDPRFTENWNGAAAAGLQRGAYHFFTFCSSGQDQAVNYLHVVPVEADALPPAIDLELSGNCSARPPAATVQQQ